MPDRTRPLFQMLIDRANSRRRPRDLSAADDQRARWFTRVLAGWKVLTALAVIGGVIVIGRAAWMINAAYLAVPPVFITGVQKTLAYAAPLLGNLLVKSLNYVWQPIALYLLILCSTRSTLWRKFWCLVGVAGFFLIFVAALEHSTWKEYHQLPLIVLQGYLFSLWLLPREVWNLVGLAISIALGLIILIVPDLPTAFDDFGLFGAILAFFLGYVNALANLTQRLARWV